MMKAAALGLTDIVKELLDKGANKNIVAKNDKRAVDYANQFKSAATQDLVALLS